MSGAAREFPPIVYLPCVDSVTGPAEGVIELRTTRDGRKALLAYSAYDRMRACCGDRQPWVAVPTQALEALYGADPSDLVLLDVVVPEHQWRGVTR